jgi:hypothetical protein
MKRARHQRGSVVFDKRRKTWNFLTSENGKRRSKLIGTKQQIQPSPQRGMQLKSCAPRQHHQRKQRHRW